MEINNKILFAILLFILTIGVASAAENVSIDNNLAVSENDDVVETSVVDNLVKKSSEDNVLTAGNESGNFTELSGQISSTVAGNTLILNKNYNNTGSESGIDISQSITIDGNGHVIDFNFTKAAFTISVNNVTLKNIKFVNARSDSDGGAIYWDGDYGTLENCSFDNCSSNYGGAIYWNHYTENGTISNCNFVNCSSIEKGGAIYFYSGNGIVANCNFTDCYSNKFGGAIMFGVSTIYNCSFVNCSLVSTDYKSGGGAITISSEGIVSYCRFENCSSNQNGGAISCFFSEANCYILNCNFTDNSASENGGAIYFNYYENGSVFNCSFVNCSSRSGGAIYLDKSTNCSVLNCSFKNGFSTSMGSFIYSYYGSVYCSVLNCSFKNGSSNSGAIYWECNNGSIANCHFTDCYSGNDVIHWYGDYGTVADCSFVNCSASYDSGTGGIYWYGDYGTVANCSFVDCFVEGNSDEGSSGAIFWYRSSRYGCVDNCSFVNCSSRNNKGGAIYWAATDGCLDNCSFVDCYSDSDGGAIYFDINIRDCFVLNCSFVNCSSRNGYGGAIYSDVNGNITSCSFENCSSHKIGGAVYLFSSNGIVDNCSFINCSSNSNGGAVYLSNGIVDNCSFINCSSNSNGGAIYIDEEFTILDCAFSYCTSVSEGGAIYCVETSGYSTISGCSFVDCSSKGSDSSSGGAMSINSTKWVDVWDCNFTNCSSTYGGAIKCVGNESGITDSIFINCLSSKYGGAIYFEGDYGYVANCSFVDCSSDGNSSKNGGGAICFEGNNATISDSTFENCYTNYNGGAIYIVNSGRNSISGCRFVKCSTKVPIGNGGAISINDTGNSSISNCSFENCSSVGAEYQSGGGAIFWAGPDGTISACTFVYCSSEKGSGGAIYYNADNGIISDCSFVNCYSYWEAGAIYLSGNTGVTGCSFEDCSSRNNGGAILRQANGGSISDCSFVKCSTESFGGAIYYIVYEGGSISGCSFEDCSGGAIIVESDNTSVVDCNFDNCSSGTGGAIDWYGDSGVINNSNFTNCSSEYDGGSISWSYGDNGIVSNCIFEDSSSKGNGGAIYWNGANGVVQNSKFYRSKAKVGGAIFVEGDNDLDSSTSTFEGNTAEEGQSVYPSLTNTTLLLDTNISYVGDNVSVMISVSNMDYENINVTVGLYINGAFNCTTNTAAPFLFVPKEMGNYTFKAIFNGIDGNFASESDIVTLTAVKKELNITVSIDDFDYGNVGNVSIVSGDVTGILDVSLYDTSNSIIGNYSVELKNGKGSLTLSDLAAGSYVLHAAYGGDSTYFNSSCDVMFTVNKVNSTVDVDDVVLNYGDSVSVNVTVVGASEITAMMGSNFSFYVSGFTIVLPVLDAGTYDVTVTAVPDENHISVSKTFTITVNKIAPVMSVNATGNINCGEVAQVNVAISSYATGSIVVIADGRSFYGNIVDGFTSVEINNLPSGTNNVSIEYGGDSNYLEASDIVQISVAKLNPVLDLTVDDFVYGKTGHVIVNVPKDATGSVQVYVDGVLLFNVPLTKSSSNSTSVINTGNGFKFDDVSISNSTFVIITGNSTSALISNEPKVSNGVVNVPLNNLGAGNHAVEVRYSGDSKYLETSANDTFIISKVTSVVNVVAGDVSYGEVAYVNATVSSGATGNVTIIVNGKSYTAIISGGSASVALSNLAVGNYNVSVNYNGDSNYLTSSGSTAFNVASLNPSIDLSVGDVDYGDDAAVNVNLPSDATGSVSIYLNHELVANASLSGGVASYDLIGLTAGQYNVSVSYAGDERYRAISASKMFSVAKATPQLSVAVADVSYGETAYVNVVLPGDATGNVNVVVGDKSYGAVLSGGAASVTLSGFAAGSHIVQVSYNGDSNYRSASKSASLKVSKLNSQIGVSVADVSYGETAYVNVTVSGGATGNVSVIVEGKSYNAVLSGGAASVALSDLAVGSHIIQVSYNGDLNYRSASNTASFKVSKLAPQIVVSVADVSYGETAYVSVVLPGDATGNVNVVVGDKSYGAVLSGGAASVTLSGFAAGDYNVQVSYDGDSNYLSASNSTSFKVSKLAANMVVNADYDIDKAIGMVNITLPVDATGSVSIYLNDAFVSNVTLVNGAAFHELSALAVGTYTVNVVYDGDSKYLANSANDTFSIDKKVPAITVKANGIVYGNTAYVNVTLPDDATGNVSVIVDGKSYGAVISGGFASVAVAGLSAGDHMVAVEYGGSSKYLSASANSSISVAKITLKITASTSDIVYGGIEDVTATFSEKINGQARLVLTKDNKVASNVTAAVKDGSVSYEFSGLDMGTYKLDVYYSDVVNYLSVSSARDFVVMADVKVTPEVTVGDNGEIHINLPKVNDVLSVKIDNKAFGTAEIKNGVVDYKFSTSKLSTGNHTITFEYKGDKFDANIFNYFDSQVNKFIPVKYNVYVAPKEVTVPDVLSSKDDGYLVLEFPKNATGSVEVILDFVGGQKKVVVDIVDGIAKIDLSAVKNGKYNVTFTYSGDGVYAGFSKSLQVNLNAKVSKIKASNAKVLYTAKGKYSVKVYDNKGKLAKGIKVTFLINGKKYKTVKTNKKGIASFVVTKTPGTYKITSMFLNIKVTKKLTVKHLVSLKSITVKKSAKSYILTATLAKVNKKYLQKKSIAFKFNGRPYSAKTDKNGVAKVVVDSSVLKNVKVGKKITYQAKYLKDTVVKKVTVKK